MESVKSADRSGSADVVAVAELRARVAATGLLWLAEANARAAWLLEKMRNGFATDGHG